MIDKIIRFSINNKLIVGLFILVLIGAGIYSMLTIKLGSVPDITNNQVQVITVAPNLGTEDIEQFVTYPVELAVANLPSVTELRSVSRFGLSVVTIVFSDEMGTYLPRQLVQEKLTAIQESIPAGFGKPFMAPIATGLGEIYQYSIVPKKGYETKYSPSDLRTIQDWIVKRQMALVPGVVEINSFGGNVKQYEIALNPNKLNSMGISINEVFEALETNNSNTGGAYIEKNHQASFIRGEGLARSLADIENIVVKNVENTPLLIKDVADEVHFGTAVRYGAFTEDGQESVGGQVLMLKGENPNEVIKNVQKRISNIQKSLPEGLEIKPFLDRSDLIARTTSTVSKNLIEGALIVIFVLVLLLGSLRGGLLTASIIPLSLLFAFILMKATGVWANLMSLGAIDFGIIVDGAVIIVEGTVHHIEQRLKKNKINITTAEMDELTYKSSSMMMNAAFFGQLIILIVFTPILFLTGVEGKMFTPMAYTFGFAVLGALLLCLTYVPVMVSLFMKPSPQGKNNIFTRSETWLNTISNKVMAAIFKVYKPLIQGALKFRKTTIAIASGLFIIAALIFSNMGGEFIPKLDEGDIAMQIIMKPGSSLSESIKVSEEVENIIKNNFPEVITVVGRIGVAEIPTDPMPMDIADCFIILEKDVKKWTSADNKAELIELMQEKLKAIVGVNFIFSQPVELRFNELLTGVREDVAIKLYGNDLDVLAIKAEEMAKIIQTVEGAADVRAEATEGLPQITVIYQREKLAKYGLNIDKLNRYVSTAFAGANAGIIFEGEKRFDLVVRFAANNRESIEDLKNLFVDLPNTNTQIPLKELADISYKPGPMQISRDNTYRRVSVGVNVRGRDVESMVGDIQLKLDKELNLPEGYFIEYGGSFENLLRAKERLSIVVPIALFLIFILLYFALNSIKQAAMIYMAVPLAAIGGILSLSLRGMPFSISAGVGFVVLFGVAVLNGLVLVSRFNSLKLEGMTDVKLRIFTATEERLRPILLTAIAAIMGFLPMAISASAGAEVQRPLATVVIGGLISSTLLTLLVVPILYYFVENGTSFKSKLKMKISKTTLLIIGMVFSMALNKSYAQTAPIKISIEDAVKIAMENNPLIKGAQLEIEKQQSLKKTNFDLDKTAINYTRGQINSPQIDYEWNISQDFKFPTIYGTQAKLQADKIKLSETNLIVENNKLERNVRAIYLELWFTKNKSNLISSLEKEYENFALIAEKKYALGETNLIEKIAAEGKNEAIRLLKSEVELDIKSLTKQLQLLMNMDVSFEISNKNLEKIPFKTFAEENTENPILLLQQNEIAVKEREHKLENAKFLPDLSAGYFNQQIDGVKNFSGFEVGLKIPLFFRAQQGKSQAAKKSAEIASINYQQTKLELDAIVQTKLNEYEKQKAALAYYDSTGIFLADKLFSSAIKAYKDGEIGYVEYIALMEQSIEIRSSYLNALNLHNQTVNEINYLTGKYN
ncbi:CusA/CzcA family heavy metal efflux RND transporter [Lutibacter maritimus]|uniref:Cobalt-zinc-cadmium resistance protein CzcA n=1 Tax=Lutibacter maritimus TaxID=593133 RepID=A0A1I6Q0E2_9FLAO|nr:CusA/CzcA family heavy metal efflux RND transporter [Lutibacter maritimus]SFS45798.1 cobalt-zinc-cadmium resistance protein CzcA [Lutibacter maritimus]